MEILSVGSQKQINIYRTIEALAAKKRAGVKLGRLKGSGKSKPDKYCPEIEALLKTGSNNDLYPVVSIQLSLILAGG